MKNLRHQKACENCKNSTTEPDIGHFEPGFESFYCGKLMEVMLDARPRTVVIKGRKYGQTYSPRQAVQKARIEASDVCDEWEGDLE